MARIGIPGRVGPDDTDWLAQEIERRRTWEREQAAALPTLVTGIVAALVLRPGVIVEYGSLTAPAGFLLCDGTQYPQTTYPDLYAVIGATFNTGGETAGYFRVPDKRGRVGVGYDASQAEFNTVGETGGEATHTLTAAEMPSHGHAFSGSQSHSHTYSQSGRQAGSTYQSGSGWDPIYATSSTSPTMVTISGTTGGAGSGTAHNNLQPYIAVPYIIKT